MALGLNARSRPLSLIWSIFQLIASVKTYAGACRNHRQEIIAFICGTIGRIFARKAKSQSELNQILSFVGWGQTNI